MLIIPAIDIRNGRCVRLLQGDPDRQTVYSDDPVGMARSFEEAGARLIHVVDLDGAFGGSPVNHGIIASIAGALSIPIEVGGGIRTVEDIARYRDAGIGRVILGTVLLAAAAEELIREHAGVIIAGIDARDGMVATHGWKKVSTLPAITIIKELQKSGINEIIFTDIATDGMLSGPNMDSLNSVLASCPGVSLIASGGVSSLGDIEALAGWESRGIRGCIVGKAIYDGRIDVREALARFP